VKRKCEKNGYYDSLRGRRPSDATIAGSKRMWQEVREGKREHPAKIMKREHPRKYREYVRRKSEERKRMIRQEQMRVLYGLERKTKLKCVVMCKYTKRQINHRRSALLRGYILMEDCSEQGGERYNIYYDDETKRTPAFERNLVADGFKLAEWQD
jgi:hypothetical protein